METFTWDVDFSTPFEKVSLSRLRLYNSSMLIRLCYTTDRGPSLSHARVP